MKLQALGIDLAKNVLHLVGLDSSGQVVVRKRCSHRQVLAFTANVQVGVVGMEACSGAHFLGRALREQGHEVRLMPAQYVEQALPRILEDAELNLSGSFRVRLAQLQLELEQLAARIEQMDTVIQQEARENEACQRLTTIPGVGPVTATALIGAIGNGSAFGKGRDLSAWMGIVPGEYSTGGKQKLLGISKRGNPYLRRLFVQGARSVLQHRDKQAPGLSHWLAQLLTCTHQNVVIVALANKLVRMAWAILYKNESYRPPVLAVPT